MNAGAEEKDGRTRRGDSERVVDLADPARGDDPNEFEGRHLGVGFSIVVVDALPGGDPKLHRHSYEEVFVVQEGTATFTAGDEKIEVTGGQLDPTAVDASFRDRAVGPVAV